MPWLISPTKPRRRRTFYGVCPVWQTIAAIPVPAFQKESSFALKGLQGIAHGRGTRVGENRTDEPQPFEWTLSWVLPWTPSWDASWELLWEPSRALVGALGLLVGQLVRTLVGSNFTFACSVRRPTKHPRK